MTALSRADPGGPSTGDGKPGAGGAERARGVLAALIGVEDDAELDSGRPTTTPE
jgi:hypothetical protein